MHFGRVTLDNKIYVNSQQNWEISLNCDSCCGSCDSCCGTGGASGTSGGIGTGSAGSTGGTVHFLQKPLVLLSCASNWMFLWTRITLL